MAGERFKNSSWTINKARDGSVSTEAAQLTVLMDIRDELQKLNALLGCHNFVAVPSILREIRGNTRKPKRKKRKKKVPGVSRYQKVVTP